MSVLARVPRVLWLIVALQTFVLLCVTIIYPAFQEADEAQHVDYVLAHRHGDWMIDPGKRFPQIGVLNAYGSIPNIAVNQHLADASVVARTKRPSFDHLGKQLAPPNTIPNQMSQHPFGYYGLAAGWSFLLPDFSHRGWDVQVFWLRLLSVLLMMPVPLLIYFSARRLTRPRAHSHAIALVATMLPAAVPSYLRVGASVTNDVLLVLLGTLVMYELSKVLTGDLRRSTALRTGLWWGLMLLTKGIALVMPPVIILAYLIGANGSFWSRIKSAFLPCLITGITGFLIGGWWYIRNVIDYGAVQPRGKGPAWPITRIYGVNRSGTNSKFIQGFFSRISDRYFGSLGLIQQPGWPGALLGTAFVLMLVLLVVGIVVGIRGSKGPRWTAVALLLPSGICLALLTVNARHTYLISHVFPGVQVRYFLGFIGALMLVLAVALFALLGKVARWLPAAVFAAVTLFEVANAGLLLAHQYGTSTGSLGHRLQEGFEFVTGWAPFAIGVTWTLIVLAFVAGIATFLMLLRSSEPQQADPGDDGAIEPTASPELVDA